MQDSTVQNPEGVNPFLAKNQDYRQMTPVHLSPPRNSEQYNNEHADTLPAAPSNEDTLPSAEDSKSQVNWEKRYSDLQSYTDKRIAELVEQNKATLAEFVNMQGQLKEATTVKRVSPLSDEELKEVASSYPNFDKLAQTRAIEIEEAVTAKFESKIAALEKKLQDAEKEKARQKLKSIHPDFDKLETDPEFKAWFDEQPRGVQALVLSENIAEISRGISLYKNEKGLDTKTKKEKEVAASMAPNTDAAMAPDGKTVKQWRRSEIKALSTHEFEKNADEINKALREGRIIDN